MVLKASPGVGGEFCGSSNAIGGEIRECGVVGLAVVHQDLGLSTDAEMFLGALRGVGHGDERDVGVSQGLGGFPA